MFYNTGIGTYLWIVANKKSKERKGKVQLIDATSLKSSLRKNIGDKKCEITPEMRKDILRLYTAFEDANEQYSRVFDNSEFGFWSIDIMRPLRLAVNLTEDNLSALRESEPEDSDLHSLVRDIVQNAEKKRLLDFNAFMEALGKLAEKNTIRLTAKRVKAIRTYFTETCADAERVILKEHPKDESSPVYGIFPIEYEVDKSLKDTELVPFTYEGGFEAFFRNEILPYTPDAWINKDSIVIGYEVSFTKYFFKPAELRPIEEILTDIEQIENDTDGLLAGIIREVRR